jgi:hypothetical protein
MVSGNCCTVPTEIVQQHVIGVVAKALVAKVAIAPLDGLLQCLPALPHGEVHHRRRAAEQRSAAHLRGPRAEPAGRYRPLAVNMGVYSAGDYDLVAGIDNAVGVHVA